MTRTSRLFVSCCALLVFNPVVLAASSVSAASPARAAHAAANAAGNPYSFYGSVAECAAAQRDRCGACLADGSCTAITNLGDGNAECMQLAANGGRGDDLICINLALAIDAVAACAASSAPSCPRAIHASDSIASLEANAGFLDDHACAAPLDACLATLYGAPGGGFPGPGSGSGSAPSPPPRHTSIGCGDSFSGDPNCDASPDCELDGPSCDAPNDGTCADSNEQSGCSDAGGDGGGGDSCSGDSGDGSSCDSGDGGDCSSGDGGDCSSGDGGDCSSGGGGDCSGGGGDCSGGGGGDCNVAGRRGSAGAGLPVAIAWALLPIPFATIVRRRAERRRARAEYDAEPPDAEPSDAESPDAEPPDAEHPDVERGAAP